MALLCIECYVYVRRRQESVQCDGCFRWQHRLCGTGISQAEYRAALPVGHIDWACLTCTVGVDPFSPPRSPSPLDDMYFSDFPPIKPIQYDSDSSSSSSYESSPEKPRPFSIDTIESPVSGDVGYYIVEARNNKAKDLLVDERGYRYAMKADNKHTEAIWRCAVWNRIVKCPASVTLRRRAFIPGKREHICDANPRWAKNAKSSGFGLKPVRRRIFPREIDLLDSKSVAKTIESPVSGDVTYNVEIYGTNKGKDLLTDSLGNHYVRKRSRRDTSTPWQCIRMKRIGKCMATVTQTEGEFIRGQHEHTCGTTQGKAEDELVLSPPEPGPALVGRQMRPDRRYRPNLLFTP